MVIFYDADSSRHFIEDLLTKPLIAWDWRHEFNHAVQNTLIL